MSSESLKFGYVGQLARPITDKNQREAISGELYEKGWGINYEGTLVYQDLNHSDDNIYKLVMVPAFGATAFADNVQDLGHDMHVTKIKFYSCVHNDGSDFELDELTVSEFMELR